MTSGSPGRVVRASQRVRRLRSRLQKLLQIVGKRRYRNALIHYGVAAAVEHQRIPFRRDVACVVDVGASRGQFALLALERFSRLDALICIEPLPRAFGTLARVLADVPFAILHNVAAGECAERRLIHLAKTDTSSSLLPATERQLGSFPDTEERSTVEVAVAPLDALVSQPVRPCLLKIDVQGFEHAVLRGAAGLLHSVDEALVECSFVELYAGQRLAGDVIALLSESGLELAGVFNATYAPDGACLQADLLFRSTPTG